VSSIFLKLPNKIYPNPKRQHTHQMPLAASDPCSTVVIHTPDVMADFRLNYNIFPRLLSSVLVLILTNVNRFRLFTLNGSESDTVKEIKARMKFQYLPCKVFELALFLIEWRNGRKSSTTRIK